MSERKPPKHNLDAESAVLSAILLEPEVTDRVSPILKPECFYSDANRRIYEAVVALVASKTSIDIVSVASWLRDRDWLTQVGGAAYIAQIADATPSIANVEEHATIVRDLSDLRDFQREADKTQALAYGDVGESVHDFMSARIAAMTRIADRQSVGSGIMLADLMAERFRAIMEPEKFTSSLSVRTGIAPLDRRMGPIRGKNLLLIAAHSGIGKTSLGIQAMVSMASQTSMACTNKACGGYVVGMACELCGCTELRSVRNACAIFSLEESREETHDRIVFPTSKAKSPYVDMHGRTIMHEASTNAVMSNLSNLARLPIKVFDDVRDMVSLRARCLSFKREVEARGDRFAGFLLDYLQLASPGGTEQRKSTNREQEVAANSRMTKNIAMELDCVAVALAQLNNESRKEKRKPRLDDIRESKAPGMDANKAILIYNPALEDRIHSYVDGDVEPAPAMDCADLIIAKCRGGGRTGIVRVAFYPEHTLFAPWPEGEPMPENTARQDDDEPKRRR